MTVQPMTWRAVVIALLLGAGPLLLAYGMAASVDRPLLSSGVRDVKVEPPTTLPARPVESPTRTRSLPRQFKGLVPEVGPRPPARRAAA